jgi:CubicO group peptidase (beta-lactamase class C family)
MGWDFKSIEGYTSAGKHFGASSFGHTGFTGTSMWIDPEADVFAILLTNRVYPSRRNTGHVQIRPKFADLAFDMVAN